MIVTKRPIEDPEVLRFLFENSDCFFNRITWFHILGKGFKGPMVNYCLERDGRIVLVLPGMIFNFGLIKMFYSNIPYGGFVGDFQLIPSTLPLIENILKKDGIHFIRIGTNFAGNLPDLNGYQREMAVTHLLDLQGMTEGQLWKGYKKRVRRDIRKAEKSGVSIHEATQPEEIDLLYDLYSETMKRNEAFNIWTKKMLHAIDHDLAAQGEAKILMAKLHGEVIAGAIFLFSPDTTYYFFAASARKYLSLCPNDLLVHHGIVLTIQKGKRYYDLMTSPKEDVALMHFKEKWGAQKYPYCFYEKNLTSVRPWLWKRIWRLIKTPIGARLIRSLRLG